MYLAPSNAHFYYISNVYHLKCVVHFVTTMLIFITFPMSIIWSALFTLSRQCSFLLHFQCLSFEVRCSLCHDNIFVLYILLCLWNGDTKKLTTPTIDYLKLVLWIVVCPLFGCRNFHFKQQFQYLVLHFIVL